MSSLRTACQLVALLCVLLPPASWAVPMDPTLAPAATDPLAELEAPGSVTPALRHALELLNQGKLDESIAEVRAVLELEPDSAPGYEILGAALAKQGELEAAAEALETATRLEPFGLTGLRKLGNVQLARGDTEAARASFERVLEVDSSDRIAHQRLGIIAQGEGRHREATEHYELGLVGAPPGYVGVKIDLARLYNAAGRYADTVQLLRPVADQAESDAALAAALGTAYLELGDTWAAMRPLRQLVRLRPDEAAAAYLMALAHRRAEDPEAALSQARRAASLQADWALAHLLVGELLLELGRPHEALAPLTKAASLSRDPSLPRLRLALAHGMAGDRKRARAVLEELVAAGTTLPGVYVSLGTLQQEVGDLDAARATYTAALEKFPEDPEVLGSAGAYYGFVQDYGRAIPLLERALERKPHDRRALRSLAWACARSGRVERARETGLRLVERDSSIENRLLLANVFRETEANPEAAELYEEILVEEPQQVVALANLSLIRAEEERWEDARKLARRAAALLPPDSPVRRTLDPVLGGEATPGSDSAQPR